MLSSLTARLFETLLPLANILRAIRTNALLSMDRITSVSISKPTSTQALQSATEDCTAGQPPLLVSAHNYELETFMVGRTVNA
jgi:hypothetical protein